MKFYHGTSCGHIDSIMRDGLHYTRQGERGRWNETNRQQRGVYLTTDLNEARSFACEATKYITDEMDLESESPDPMDACVVEIMQLPESIQIIPDTIVPNNTMFMTNAQDIPSQYLRILKPRQIAQQLHLKLKDLCLAETPNFTEEE